MAKSFKTNFRNRLKQHGLRNGQLFLEFLKTQANIDLSDYKIDREDAIKIAEGELFQYREHLKVR